MLLELADRIEAVTQSRNCISTITGVEKQMSSKTEITAEELIGQRAHDNASKCEMLYKALDRMFAAANKKGEDLVDAVLIGVLSDGTQHTYSPNDNVTLTVFESAFSLALGDVAKLDKDLTSAVNALGAQTRDLLQRIESEKTEFIAPEDLPRELLSNLLGKYN